MKRLIPIMIVVLGIGGMSTVASAFNYHTGLTLICSDCHTAHASQSHGNGDSRGAPFDNVAMGAAKPFDNLLRNEPNELCLTCHNDNAVAPDVLGDNHGKYTAGRRQAGALNDAAVSAEGYDPGDGHTLGSTAAIPGNTTGLVLSDGLECVSCHSQHGSKTQFRNLLNRDHLAGKNVTYENGTFTNTKDVLQTADLAYYDNDIKFEEPKADTSAYAAWCQGCHTSFHGKGGDVNMGGASGGFVLSGVSWKRHPTADVNIGGAVTDSMTFVSSLASYRAYYALGAGRYPKVMDSQGLWTGAYSTTTHTGDNTLTPSCFSCHKGHGNKNPFGLVFLGGAGPATEEGDGGTFRGMCRGCHSQGAP